MAKVRRTVRLDADVDRTVRDLAGDQYSAFVNEALRRQIRWRRLNTLVQRDAAERGDLDGRQVTAVDRELIDLDWR